MKAMLLAAGLGSRLRPLTDALPKCMVPVAGTPLLARNIAWLREHGVTDLCVNLHYFPEAVTRYFGDGRDFGVRLRYSSEPELRGTAGALDAVRDWLADAPFLVLYADNLIRLDLAAFLELHHRTAAALTMALFWREDVRASGVAQLTADGQIRAFQEKPAPGMELSHWVNAGLFCCTPAVLRFIPAGRFSDFGFDVLPAMTAAGERLQGYQMGEYETLRWVDTLADLAATEAALIDAEAAQ